MEKEKRYLTKEEMEKLKTASPEEAAEILGEESWEMEPCQKPEWISEQTGRRGKMILEFMQEQYPTLWELWMVNGEMYRMIQDRIMEADKLEKAIREKEFERLRPKEPGRTQEVIQASYQAAQTAKEEGNKILFAPVLIES